ncbi:MAG: response regulator [Anaerolineales bacterium]|jgi:pilus assembly protein CpaE|nr:response regulator [Anaerolineales bacterium]
MTADEKFRVLIVDDDAETRENIRKLLSFESDVNVVGTARTGREAIQLSQEFEPDVVLMDINMPDMDGIATTEAIRLKQPVVQIVILSVQGDPNYMRRAMLAGARDFLIKPPMGDELISAIRRAGLMAQQERKKNTQAHVAPRAGGQSIMTPGTASQGKIITVYSPKGGTGCTTVAVNLAVALNNNETRVVIVDGNLQFGDVTVFLNEQAKNSIADLASRADELDPEIVEDVMIKHAASGLRVLAAPVRPEYADTVTGNQLTKILKYLRHLFAYVVVDTTPMLTDITLAAIDTSDVVILITTQDIPALKSARLFLDLSQTLGIERERIIFVMNRYSKRIAITSEKVSENLKQEILTVIPLDENVVIPATNSGIPFVLSNKAQPSARGIFTLAENVRGVLSKIEGDDENKKSL